MFRRVLKAYAKLGKDEVASGWEFLDGVMGDAFVGIPTDEDVQNSNAPLIPKELSFSCSLDSDIIFKGEKLRSVNLVTHEGTISVTPGNPLELYKVLAGPVELYYPNDKVDRFFTSGGFVFTHQGGQCVLTTHEMIRVSDLDPAICRMELQKVRQNLKSRDIKVKVDAWIRFELLEKLDSYLEEYGE